MRGTQKQNCVCLVHGMCKTSLWSFQWLFVFILAFPVVVRCQTVNDKVKTIRQTFQSINSDVTLQKVTLSGEKFLEQATDGGGELTGYFKADSILKITEDIGLSFGLRHFEYYFKSGHLIFIYETEEDFPYNDSTGSLDYSNPSLVFEGRFYFDEASLIKKIVKGKKLFGEDPTDKDPTLLIRDAKKCEQLLITTREQR